jgi:hypothetical protein
MKKFQQLYVKYLIKNPALFYGFIGLFLIIFLVLSLSIKLDVVKSYPASIAGNVISVESANAEAISGNKVYYYTNRNEKIYKSEANDISADDGEIKIVITGNEQGEISGEINIDLVVGKQALLERIFVKAGKN